MQDCLLYTVVVESFERLVHTGSSIFNLNNIISNGIGFIVIKTDTVFKQTDLNQDEGR